MMRQLPHASIIDATTTMIQRRDENIGVAMAAIALLAMPLVHRPVEKESAAPERGEQLAPHLLDMLDGSAEAGASPLSRSDDGRTDFVV